MDDFVKEEPVFDSVVFAKIDEASPSENGEEQKEEEKPVGWRSYISITVLCIINLLNYMDRFTIAGVLTDIQTYYDINDAQGGLLQTIFMAFFIVFSPICGYLGDRYNRKYIMIAGIAIWVSAVFASTFIPKNLFWLFLLIRGVVGIGEASYAIISPSMIADMFTGKLRSRMFMVFYFFIPVGCGMGYIVGGAMDSATGHWQWGVRITAIFGVMSLFLISIFITEPERGKAERDVGEIKNKIESTSYWQDMVYLVTNPTYVTSSIGYTATVFVVGTLAFWAPTAIQYRDAYKKGYNSTDELGNTKDQITSIFGIITCVGGIFGVTAGTILSYWMRTGAGPFRYIKTNRSDAVICAVGAAIGIPCFFFSIICMKDQLIICWILLFICIVVLSFNWATNVDLLMMVVVPSRRNSANSWQILISHLFGDASGPYILGLISDWIRGSGTTQYDHFHSLLMSFYLPNVILIVSTVFFVISAITFVKDHEKFQLAVGALDEATNSDESSLPEKKEERGISNDSFYSVYSEEDSNDVSF